MRACYRLIATLLLSLMVSTQAHARLYIEISKNVDTAMPIAIVPFGWTGQGNIPEDIAAIIEADLSRSGRFAPLALSELPERPTEGDQIHFSRWRGTGSDNLVIGRLKRQGGSYLVEFQLFDLVKGQQLMGYSIPVGNANLRTIAHQISDLLYEKLTGEPGAFNTFIAYVTVQTQDNERQFRLAVADADGYNEQIILTSKQPLMSPAWSPDGQRLAYVSFENGRSEVFVQDVFSGKRRSVAMFDGLNSAPVWSPDGKRLALTLSRDGNAEVYLMELASGKLTRLTRHYAIDTEPTFTPDGNALIFTSDRGGQPQLYRVELGQSGVRGSARRLTYEGRYNARAAISPDGKQVAMVHGDGSRFRIAIQELESGNLRLLTDSRLDESPSFAPNGAMIIYATEENNRGVLEVVSVDGRARQRLTLQQGDVREPAWSPFLAQ